MKFLSREGNALHSSLVARLTVLFTLASLSIMAGMAYHLYGVVDAELRQRTFSDLSDKVEFVRRLLRQYGSVYDVERDDGVWRALFVAESKMRLNLLDERRRVLIGAADFGIADLASATAAPPDRGPAVIVDWRDREGRRYRVASAWGHIGGRADKRVLIYLAYEEGEYEAFLATHRGHQIVAVLVGTIVAAVIGFLLTFQSLRQIGKIADATRAITVSDLEKRLDVGDAPSEIRNLAGAFNAMLEHLHGSFQRLSEFSAHIAHELRTPINNLLGQSQVALSRDRSEAELREVLESNVEECERISRIIDSMLFLARADNARVVVNKEAIELGSEVRNTAEFFRSGIEETGIRITCRGDAQVRADRTLLQQALGNLLANAVRHTPDGGEIEIVVTGKRDQGVDVAVSNVGAGIAPKQLDRVFDRFYRAQAWQRDSHQGAGLGLAIVKSIMSLHGGRVSVRSEPNKVTTFTLHFP